jgi:hypothetical protein
MYSRQDAGAMAYERTKVEAARSQVGIRNLLMTCGGAGIAFISQPPMEGFEALMPIDGVTYKVRIQADVPVDSRDVEADVRRIWRVFYYHMKSVFEAADSGVMEFREMMLPYIVVKDGQTIGQHILPNLAKAVESRPERLLAAVNGG